MDVLEVWVLIPADVKALTLMAIAVSIGGAYCLIRAAVTLGVVSTPGAPGVVAISDQERLKFPAVGRTEDAGPTNTQIGALQIETTLCLADTCRAELKSAERAGALGIVLSIFTAFYGAWSTYFYNCSLSADTAGSGCILRSAFALTRAVAFSVLPCVVLMAFSWWISWKLARFFRTVKGRR